MAPKVKKRRKRKLNATEYDLLVNLFTHQPWLHKLTQPMSELMDMCHNLDEQVLVSDLLNRFCYVTSSQSGEYLDQMVSQIIDVWDLPEDRTQIVAITFDEDPDSGQQILQMLKSRFVAHRWSRMKLVNRIGRSVRYLQRFPNIVYVDEFIGTGKTMVKRIEDFRKTYDSEVKNKNLEAYKISVCVLASMIDAKDFVEKTGVDLFAAKWLKKGISDYLKGEKVRAAWQHMFRLESRLEEMVGELFLPWFGYDGTEALYSMEQGNAPNSVFPVFWWPYYAGGKRRSTLLQRMDSGLS